MCTRLLLPLLLLLLLLLVLALVLTLLLLTQLPGQLELLVQLPHLLQQYALGQAGALAGTAGLRLLLPQELHRASTQHAQGSDMQAQHVISHAACEAHKGRVRGCDGIRTAYQYRRTSRCSQVHSFRTCATATIAASAAWTSRNACCTAPCSCCRQASSAVGSCAINSGTPGSGA